MSGKETKVIPACTPQLTTMLKYPNNRDYLRNQNWNHNSGNIHCIYNITSATGYINLTVTQLTTTGYDWNSAFHKCYFSGLAFKTLVSKIFSTEKLKYKAPRDCQAAKHSVYYVCGNFTSRYNLTGRHDKSMIDVISDTGWFTDCGLFLSILQPSVNWSACEHNTMQEKP